MNYWVAVVARNAEKQIAYTIQSLLDQSLKPDSIVVVNDGSTDRTREIVAEYSLRYSIVKIMDRPDKGFDIRRVPSNLNLALNSNRHFVCDFVMISGDDCIYPPAYVESIVNRMMKDTQLVIASGRPSEAGLRVDEHSPSGSGRIVRVHFLREVGFSFPAKAGWEAWLLYTAEQQGCRSQLFKDLSYSHVRPRGAKHHFRYWGAAMYTLGYHPLYALGRIVLNLVKRASIKSALGLFVGYLDAVLGSSDPFMSPFDGSLRRFVYVMQQREIARLVSAQFGKLVVKLVDDRHLPA